MIASRTPKARTREMVISSSVRPLISTRAFGRSSVSGRKRVPRPAARIIAFIGLHPSSSSVQLLLLAMMHDHFHPRPAAQTLRQLLGQIYRAMLTAGTSERDHQVFEATTCISADTGFHQGAGAGEKLVDALLRIEIVDHSGVFAGKTLEALFAPGIRETAAIENESTTVSSLVLGQAAVKGKTKDPHRQLFRLFHSGTQPLQPV